jgi:hypothetical protein
MLFSPKNYGVKLIHEIATGLEEHVDELPSDDAVIHRQDAEPGLGVDHRHGAWAEKESRAEPIHRAPLKLSSSPSAQAECGKERYLAGLSVAAAVGEKIGGRDRGVF